MRAATAFTAATLSLAAAAMATPAAAISLDFIGQQVIATGATFDGTVVGGLSGIDYDAGTGRFAVISDDRSQFGAARVYRFELGLTAAAFTAATPVAVTTLLRPDGTAYPEFQIDPEAIRRTAAGTYIYTSEGDGNPARLQTPFVREMAADGSFLRDFAVDAAKYAPTGGGPTGIRNNLAFESLAISPDGSTVFTATENALAQDGPTATLANGSANRILAFDMVSGAAIGEFVYESDAVAAPPGAPGGFVTSGLVELLALSDTRFIAVERSFSVGAPGTGYTIRLYDVSIAAATDVGGIASLAGAAYTPASKRLILDLESLGIPLDNIEGIAFGPRLEDGRRSLVLVSDNNFSAAQFTQFLAFSVDGIPEPSTWAMLIAGFGFVGTSLRRRRALKV
jgi:hypothetical protein